MRAVRLSGLALSIAALVGVLTLADEVLAEPVLRPTVAGAGMFSSGRAAGGAVGAFSAGYNLEYEPLLVMPELVASFGGFGGDFTAFTARLLAGVRGGVTAVVEPALFLRGGFGHATITGAGGRGLNGGTIQTGLGLDYRSGRDLTFGGEVAYDAFLFSAGGQVETIHTVLVGGTVAFWL
jgi:hypothetical protein